MIICIPCEEEDMNSEVGESFGRSSYYLVYNDSDHTGKFVVNGASNSQGGAGVKAAQIVVDQKIDVLITPQLGDNAAVVLQGAKIKIYHSKKGSLMDNIVALKDGELDLLTAIHQGYHGK